MRVLVISSCTGEKALEHERALTLEDFQRGKDVVTEREAELADLLTSAEQLYTGQQHVRLMKAVVEARVDNKISLDFYILSAGYGLISSDKSILPYEATFATMKKKELVEWRNALNIPADFRRTVAEPFDLCLILLGDNYLEACQLDGSVQLGGPTILFCGSVTAKKMPRLDKLKVITVSNPEAKRFSYNLITLKGELGARILRKLGSEGEGFISCLIQSADPLVLIEEPKVIQLSQKENKILTREKVTSNVAKKVPIVNPAVNKIITIPDEWKSSRHKGKIRYFIPEWDDLVDPDYDFINDTHSGGAGNWHNQVYAHQMFAAPNYDGILISRVVVDENKKRRELMEALGVHGSLRVPMDFPIMGDCGAFGYIDQDMPPYSTEDVLNYYSKYGFNYGVSVDHLIFGAQNEQKAVERYQLTIQNAEDFLKEHTKLGLNWRPIGAVQGWDPKSYASAAKQYVKMGYDYIALGGLVRTKTDLILNIVKEVSKVVPRSVDVHLFGLARLEAMRKFADLGITSVDSASHLRRAWLGAKDNYWTLDGERYAALRIPQPGKKLIAENPKIKELEQKCLDIVRRYDKGLVSLRETLDILDEYDGVVMENRKSMRPYYERTLLNQPWKKCPCDICKKDGIEVIIFRGNNRNRRRGFHNTYIFYALLRQLLSGELNSGTEAADLFPGRERQNAQVALAFDLE